MLFIRKKISILLLFLFIPFAFGKKSRIKKETASVAIIEKNIKENNSIRQDSDYKYVVFDVSNCFWKKSLYELLMSFRKNIKIPFKGYLELLQCGVSYAFGGLNAKKGYETFFKYFKSMSKADIKEKCKLVWEKDCKNYIYKDAFEKLEKHKKDGLVTIIVDAGISPLYDDLVETYKFDYGFFSYLEFKNGMSTGKLKGEPCSNKNKYEMVRKLIEDDLNGSLSDAIFYGNSHNDIPLLKKVGKPIAVNPSTKLRNRAKKMGWKILNFYEIKKS